MQRSFRASFCGSNAQCVRYIAHVQLLQLDKAVAPLGRLQQLLAQCGGLGETPCVTQRLRSLKSASHSFRGYQMTTEERAREIVSVVLDMSGVTVENHESMCCR